MPELNEQKFETEREAFMNQLFRTAAHDLNNILSPIIGYPELLLDQFDSASQEYADLKEIQQLAHRAVYLIKDIQMLIRPEVKILRECDLNTQIREVLQGRVLSVEARARIDAVNIELTLGEDVAPVGSTRLVLQALLNNLFAAVLSLTPDQGQASVSTNLSGSSVVLRLDHQFPELSEEDATRLMEPFFLKKKFSSTLTGLELTVVAELVAQHQGSYEIEYKNGELHHVCILPVFTES
jgi:signal transduction histidine kinase